MSGSVIHNSSGRRAAVFFLALAGVALMAGTWVRPSSQAMCTCEVRSWIVAMGRRHLYIDVRCPEPYAHLSGRVEFTESRLRYDYDVPGPMERRNRLAKMARGAELRPPPFVTDMRDRAEGPAFAITPAQAACLQTDRMFRAQYNLLGPNSNSALRAVAESCGCVLPARVVQSGGMMGEFPGIEMDPGPELPTAEWAMFGLPGGPQAVPATGTKAVPTRRGRVTRLERGPIGPGG